MFTAMVMSSSPEQSDQRASWASAAREHPAVEADDQVARLGGRDEVVRLAADRAPALPAHERLDAAHHPAGGIDDRLVVQEQPVTAGVERGVQVLLDARRGR